MTDFFESESFLLPQDVKNDVAGRLKEKRQIKSVELKVKGEALEGAAEFGRMLVGLKRSGVKVSHEFSIKLDFPRNISREKALHLVENMPRSRNGSLKVRIQLASLEPKGPQSKVAADL